jgi:CBS domain-containing protein
MAAMAEGADPVTTRVEDYMTPAPEVLRPDSELADAAHLMLELGIRHLPIVRSGQLVGVLSIRDVLDAETHRAEKTDRGTANQKTVRKVASPGAARAMSGRRMRRCT